MESYHFNVSNDQGHGDTGISSRHLDYIIQACGVDARTFYGELDVSYRDEFFPRKAYIALNYYCLYQTGYGLADLLIFSSEYLTATEFCKLCYLPIKGKTKAKVAQMLASTGVNPSFVASRLVRYQSDRLRVPYWHKFDFYKLFNMDSVIPILLDNPIRIWRYDNSNADGNRLSLCGGYNYVYSYRVAAEIVNIGFARLMQLEAGTITPTNLELDAFSRHVGGESFLEWKARFDSEI